VTKNARIAAILIYLALAEVFIVAEFMEGRYAFSISTLRVRVCNLSEKTFQLLELSRLADRRRSLAGMRESSKKGLVCPSTRQTRRDKKNV